jgi:hypothetical protein
MNEFRNIHLLRIRILRERKIFFIAIEYFLMIGRRQESTSACEALYLGQPTDIVIKKRGCGLVA